MGMIHAMTPSSFSPNVWEGATERRGLQPPIWHVQRPANVSRGRQRLEWASAEAQAGLRPRTHHGNGVWGEQLLGTHGCDVGDVGKDVNEGHKGDGDEDGTGKVPGGNMRYSWVKGKEDGEHCSISATRLTRLYEHQAASTKGEKAYTGKPCWNVTLITQNSNKLLFKPPFSSWGNYLNTIVKISWKITSKTAYT